MRWVQTLSSFVRRGASPPPERRAPPRRREADARARAAPDDHSAPADPAAVDERPIDLSADLDAGLATDTISGKRRISEAVLELALETDRGTERQILSEVARRMREGELRLPSMPKTVLRVQRLLDAGRCNVAELAAEIERDPALATRVIGVANSPFYRGLDPVQSLCDAIVRIGLGETRNIVLAVLLRARVFRVPGRDLEIKRLWSHSLAASVAAQIIGARVGEDPEAAFLVGLLHDLGVVVLLSIAGEIERSSKGRTRVDDALLQRLDRTLHARLGAHVAAAWRIDPRIVAAIGAHHDDGDLRDAGVMARVARCADLMAHRVRPLRPPCPVPDGAWSAALAALGLDVDVTAELEEEMREGLATRETRI